MRLINVETLDLEEHYDDTCPEYAILSHTWTKEEVTQQEWLSADRPTEKVGYDKIIKACEQARQDRLKYLWCDTNCIDKTSSADLSEAINSMFRWYHQAAICYIYLADVTCREEIPASRWMTRGWTLQELLAPAKAVIFTSKWEALGDRKSLQDELHAGTGIPTEFINGGINAIMSRASVAQRMSWVAKRQTTRVEDMAYCMLGIFGINLPPLYGEGANAFRRLQEEIIRVSSDHSLFCWTWMPEHVPSGWGSLLAPNPKVFQQATDCVGTDYSATSLDRLNNQAQPYSIANGAIFITLPFTESHSTVFVTFDAVREDEDGQMSFLSVAMRKVNNSSSRRVQWARSSYPPSPITLSPKGSPRIMQFLNPSGPMLGGIPAKLPSSLSAVFDPVNVSDGTENVKQAILLIFDNRPEQDGRAPDSSYTPYGDFRAEHGLLHLENVAELHASRGVYSFQFHPGRYTAQGAVIAPLRLTAFFAARRNAQGKHEFYCESLKIPELNGNEGKRLLWTLRGSKTKVEVDRLTAMAAADKLPATINIKGTEVLRMDPGERFTDQDGVVVQVARFNLAASLASPALVRGMSR